MALRYIKSQIAQLLDMPVDEMELSVRSSNCLKAAGIKQIRDLVTRTEADMLKYRNFGRKSLSELNEVLAGMGLAFGLDVTEFDEELAKYAKSMDGLPKPSTAKSGKW